MAKGKENDPFLIFALCPLPFDFMGAFSPKPPFKSNNRGVIQEFFGVGPRSGQSGREKLRANAGKDLAGVLQHPFEVITIQTGPQRHDQRLFPGDQVFRGVGIRV